MIVLVDTSVWIDHLRNSEPQLQALLERNEVICHPFVVGELALGTLGKREKIISDLRDLHSSIVAENDEVIHLIVNQKMHGLGLGYVDAHLLASAKITKNALLWTRDKKLDGLAQKLGLSFGERVH